MQKVINIYPLWIKQSVLIMKGMPKHYQIITTSVFATLVKNKMGYDKKRRWGEKSLAF